MIYVAGEPIEVERIWGSREGESGIRIGEIWHIYHDSGGSTPLRRMLPSEPPGELEDPRLSVGSLVEAGRLPGSGEGGVYPLLIKTLHTADALSIQVHPGLGPDHPGRKDESWFILDCSSDSWILCGFTDGVDFPAISSALRTGGEALEELLVRHRVSRGDLYHLPAGCVHSLGPGLEVLEVQRNYDVTYRLYDWGRSGADGSPRALHLEEGLDSVDWEGLGRCVPVSLRQGGGDQLELAGVVDAGYHLRFLEAGVHELEGGSALFPISGSIHSAANGGGRATEGRCLLADLDGGSVRVEGSALEATPLSSGGE